MRAKIASQSALKIERLKQGLDCILIDTLPDDMILGIVLTAVFKINASTSSNAAANAVDPAIGKLVVGVKKPPRRRIARRQKSTD